MDFYVEAAADALELLKEFGTSIPITRVSNVVNPVTGELVPTNTAGNLTAVVLPAKSTGNQAVGGAMDNAISEALTKGKVRFIIAAAANAPFAPDADDVLTFEGASWRVLGCTPLAPAGTPVIFKLGAMRV